MYFLMDTVQGTIYTQWHFTFSGRPVVSQEHRNSPTRTTRVQTSFATRCSCSYVTTTETKEKKAEHCSQQFCIAFDLYNLLYYKTTFLVPPHVKSEETRVYQMDVVSGVMPPASMQAMLDTCINSSYGQPAINELQAQKGALRQHINDNHPKNLTSCLEQLQVLDWH
ncbi:uncharacterized protein LOC135343803 isoform X2 [Halichondria panicea]|uniref:uncharacterized protein LOC135343803 isoform X2 n=1 Tax=Halichondria panicea TaxID=6063 RepID=UPI00312B8578